MLVHAYYPLAEPRVEREARAARDAGYRVVVVALRGDGEAPRETVEGVEVRRLPVRHHRGASLAALVVEYILFTVLATVEVLRLVLQRRLRVVQVHAPPDFLVLAALSARLRGARVVLDIHDLSPDLFGARFGERSVVVRLLRAVQRGATALVDEVITVHEPYRRELVAANVPPAKIEVVMNCVEEDVAARATAAASRANGAFTLAYHGTLTHWYGVDLLVDAVGRLRTADVDIRALVVGDGDELDALRARARDHCVAEAIEFSGRYIPREQALRLVAGAQCGVIPNRPSALNRFALSSKLFEYVALGMPVVVSRLETLAAHFADDEVTFFEPGSAESLAAAIRWVVEHPADAKARAECATERARTYTWTQQRERYLALLARA